MDIHSAAPCSWPIVGPTSIWLRSNSGYCCNPLRGSTVVPTSIWLRSHIDYCCDSLRGLVASSMGNLCSDAAPSPAAINDYGSGFVVCVPVPLLVPRRAAVSPLRNVR